MKTLVYDIRIVNQGALKIDLETALPGKTRLFVAPRLVVVRAQDSVNDASVESIVRRYAVS